ncbi:MAG: hypothetical protein IPK50_02035 [Fibrobacterota bacterium]|nr:hypothetical protein [Fibrobacterota bacterium]QQS05679.1 MAG: hypothetical protein IPK50_02035 [Fibrobacterota bacterium]
MNKARLNKDSVPYGVCYPVMLLNMMEDEAQDILPWRFIGTDESVEQGVQLKTKFGRDYFPVYRKGGSDLAACFLPTSEVVHIVDFTAKAGEEIEESIPDFEEFLHLAFSDFV